jgi:hypothetical protein
VRSTRGASETRVQFGVDSARTAVKPKLRGVFHELGFYAAIALGVPFRQRRAALSLATA